MKIRMLFLVVMLIIAVPFSNISCGEQQPAQEKAAQKQPVQEKADQGKTVRARPVEDEQESGKGTHSFEDDRNIKFEDQSTESNPFEDSSGENPFEDNPSREERDSTE
jgi:hypothetical protein